MPSRILLPALIAALAAPSSWPAAAQDAATAGLHVYNSQCRGCHTVERGGSSGFGPNLQGIFGRRAGAVEGFGYLSAMRAKAEDGMTWDEAALRAFLINSFTVVPGNRMMYLGLRDPQQMDDLIVFLRRAIGGFQDDPDPAQRHCHRVPCPRRARAARDRPGRH